MPAKLDVLVNAATLVKGGGIQVGASMIRESLADDMGIRWHYLLSEQVEAELRSLGSLPERYELFHASPGRSRSVRARVRALEKSLRPDVVFSVFGPTYIRFSAPHLLGVAAGWVTHSTWDAYAAIPTWRTRFTRLLECVYKGFWLRAADRWVVETEHSRQGLRRRLRIPVARVDVVPNSCASVFVSAAMPDAAFPSGETVVRFVYVSAYYAHKNHAIIPATAAVLAERGYGERVRFVVTLPADEPGLRVLLDEAEQLGVRHMIENAGPLTLNEVIDLYRDAHACFMPSLLETFSAAYPEAMALGRPIVASDLDFARTVCGEHGAVYFDVASPASAADAIVRLAGDESLWKRCIAEGRRILAALPDSRRKYELFVESIRATALSVEKD